MDTDDEMSPENSPGQQSKRTGVRRVNNLPIYIVVAGLAVFLLIMVLVAVDRAARQNRPVQGTDTGKVGSAGMFARAIAGDQKDGIIQAMKSGPSSTEALNPPVTDGPLQLARLPSAPAQPDSIAAPTSQQETVQQPVRSAREDEAERIRVLKLQQFEEAVKAKTSIPVGTPRSAASSPAMAASTAQGAPASREDALAQLAAVRQQIDAATRDDPTAAYKARLQQIQGAGQASGAASALMPAAANLNDITQFAAAGQGDRWRLESQPEAPRSPFELRAGFVVPAMLISGINSELPGQIMAQVSQDVYDTPLGKYKLIPQGSRLVGSYSNEVAYGQSRILIAWQRIIFPDGKAMDIGAMPGGDSAGYAGFKDQVNNHYLRLFSSAFLMSGITAGIALSQPESGNPYARPTASSALSEALGQQLGQVTAQLVAKNLNIAPTLEIRPGYRFNVIVIKDLTFRKPYAAFDY